MLEQQPHETALGAAFHGAGAKALSEQAEEISRKAIETGRYSEDLSIDALMEDLGLELDGLAAFMVRRALGLWLHGVAERMRGRLSREGVGRAEHGRKLDLDRPNRPQVGAAANRAAAAVATRAIWDVFRFRDGTTARRMRIGRLKRVRLDNEVEAALAREIIKRAGGGPLVDSMTIPEVVNAKEFRRIRKDAERKYRRGGQKGP